MSERPLGFLYTNWKGYTAPRRVKGPITFWFGVSPYHEGAQWFLSALCCDRKEERDFALRDTLNFHFER